MSIRCPLCHFVDNSENNLVKHITIHHRNDNCQIAFDCFLCKKVFGNISELKAHFKGNHADTSEPPFFAWEENVDLKTFYEKLLLEGGKKCDLEANLQLKAAEVLFNLKDEHNATESLINSVITGSNQLFEMFLDVIQSKFCSLARSAPGLTIDVISSTLSGFRNNSLFEGLKTEDQVAKFLLARKWLVQPKREVLDYKEVLRKDLRVDQIPRHVGYVVPFLSLLEEWLNLPEVLHCIDNPKPTKEGTFTSPLDGYYYQNHPVVKKHPGALAFGTYGDDVKFTDTASTKPVNARLFYWTLLNLYPELRSQLDAINLLFCAQTEIVKEYGFQRFLEDYIFGIKKLASGVTFTIMNTKRDFYGVHVLSSGDNPFSANLAGFKESHFADLLCRICMGTKPDIFQIFDESHFQLRSKETHEMHLKELQEYKAMPPALRAANKDPSVLYGVNSRSIYLDIPNCDVTKCFPQDLMHDVIHGTLKLEILCILDHVLNEKKILSLNIINDRIEKYAKFFGVNKPSCIETGHMQNKNLRQSAAETLILAQILPFALLKNDDLSGDIESVCDPEHLKCYILRLNVVDIQMQTEFTLQDVHLLRNMTRVHHELFVNLYPGTAIPELHFEIHLATQILLFGPLRQHWCFRNEGKHAYFKRLSKILHSFRDIFLSVSKRHQLRQASKMMLSVDAERGPYLQPSNYCGAPKAIPIAHVPTSHKALLIENFPDVKTVTKYNFVVVKSVHYAAKDAFVLKFSKGVPTLGEIVSIYGCEGTIMFIYTQLVTEKYDPSLNAFKVRHEQTLAMSPASQLIHHHKIPFVRAVNGHYVLIPCHSFLSTSFRE